MNKWEKVIFALLVMGLGIVFLLNAFHVIQLGEGITFWSVLWPFLPVFHGCDALQIGSEPHEPGHRSVRPVYAFVQCRHHSRAVLSFGSLVFDLTEANIENGATIDADVSFGSLILRLPGFVGVKSESSAAFGGVNCPTGDPNAAIRINLKGDVSFGKIEVEYV